MIYNYQYLDFKTFFLSDGTRLKKLPSFNPFINSIKYVLKFTLFFILLSSTKSSRFNFSRLFKTIFLMFSWAKLKAYWEYFLCIFINPYFLMVSFVSTLPPNTRDSNTLFILVEVINTAHIWFSTSKSVNEQSIFRG